MPRGHYARSKRPAADRFADKVAAPTETGCLEWTGWTNGMGYGRFYASADSPKVYAHRWSYEQSVGPIPDGLHLDHLCRNTICVNPYHLEPVTPAENTRRSTAIENAAAAQRAKTHCPYGHPYSVENTYRWEKRGERQRQCRACGRERMRRTRRNAKEST